MTEEQAVVLVESTLAGVATLAGGPIGAVAMVLGQLVGPIYNVLKGGATPDDTVANIKASLVAVSDADMKAELGP